MIAWGYYHTKNYGLIQRKIEEKALQEANSVFSLVKHGREKLLRHYKISPRKCHVLPWGVDTGKFKINNNQVKELKTRLNIREDTYVVLSMRNMDPYYNIQNIISAVPRVIEKHDNTVFIFRRQTGPQMFLTARNPSYIE